MTPSVFASITDGIASLDIFVFALEIFSPDCNRTISFLIDTGSVISVLPKDFQLATLNRHNPRIQLVAANGSTVSSFGDRSLSLKLPEFDENVTWKFIIADVTRPILGADFLVYFKLLVDCAGKKLIKKVSVNTIDVLANNSATLESFLQDNYSRVLIRDNSFTPVINTEHFIATKPCAPVHQRRRELAQDKRLFAEKEFLQLEEQGIIRRSSSPWASPLQIVPKKDGTYRICGDYRQVNKVTVPDAYPMPLLQEMIRRFDGCKIFSSLDLAKAYHQIPLDTESVAKTAVTTPFGLFEYLKMPFGLRNAAQTFQRHIDTVLKGLPFVAVYIDDILIASIDPEEHKRHLTIVLQRLHDNNLQLKLSKCHTFVDSVTFLGHHISANGIKPLDSRLKVITDFPKPDNITQLRSFVGMVNFCRRFVPNMSNLVAPLTELSVGKKRDKIVWTKATNEAYERIKGSLVDIVSLAFPNNELPLTLTTDASNVAVGGFLSQLRNDMVEPLEFFSHKLSMAQSRYSTFDRELLGVFLSVKHYEHMLIGRHFTIYTDHKPLLQALNMKNPSPRQQRQISYLSEFTFEMKFVAGADNVVADCLSRIELASIEFNALFSEELLRNCPPTDSDLSLFQTRPTCRNGIYFDYSLSGVARPVLNMELRLKAFQALHSITHCGFKASYDMLRTRVVWPFMRKDVKHWTQSCLSCQSSKITRHTKPRVLSFPTGSRFDTVHLDIVGPLPPCKGYTYLFTIIDRKTRWCEAFPLRSITAASIVDVFLNNWISRFGAPKRIITDQGAQFESTLFNALLKKFGSHRLRTTAYHPQSNGVVERFHRTLKNSLRSLSITKDWLSSLPYVLLGWRNIPSSRFGLSPAQMVFGANTNLLPTIFDSDDPVDDSPCKTIKDHFESLNTTPKSENSDRIFVPNSLREAVFVWLLKENPKTLQPRYIGPCKVLERNFANNTFVILVDGVKRKVNLCKVKPALHLVDDTSVEIAALSQKKVSFAKYASICGKNYVELIL